jgi:hypothetical protein
MTEASLDHSHSNHQKISLQALASHHGANNQNSVKGTADLNVKVVITPFLKPRVERRIKFIAGLLLNLHKERYFNQHLHNHKASNFQNNGSGLTTE